MPSCSRTLQWCLEVGFELMTLSDRGKPSLARYTVGLQCWPILKRLFSSYWMSYIIIGIRYLVCHQKSPAICRRWNFYLHSPSSLSSHLSPPASTRLWPMSPAQPYCFLLLPNWYWLLRSVGGLNIFINNIYNAEQTRFAKCRVKNELSAIFRKCIADAQK